MDPEIRHLRAICTIAQTGSLSRAAAELGVSQPALTALLKRVERAFGGQLFVRGRDGTRPTALGARAVERARLVLEEIDNLVGEVTRQGRAASTIRLGSPHMECVGTMTRRVREALPGTEITLLVEPSAVVLAQALAHQRLDIAIVGMMDDHDVALPAGLARRTLIPRVPVFVAISDTHRLASAAEVKLADLAGEGWICPPGPDDGSLASLRQACQRAGFEPRIRYHVPSGGARSIIASGEAVRLVEPASIAMGGMVVKPLASDPLGMRLVLAWHRHRISEAEVAQVYRAVALAYTEHASANPTYAPWWAAHPEVHPRVD